jgi:predicted DCC family thiol-disulfide oxidoreductase YuxK
MAQIAGSRYNIFGKRNVCALQHDKHADRFLQ